VNNNALKNKTFWIGWIVVVVLMQIYGYLVHEIGMAGLYEALASAFRPEADMTSKMWMMMAGGLVSLLVFCYIFTVGHEGKGILEGVRYGALMGLFVAIPTSVDSYVIYPVTGEVAVIWFFAGIAGLVIAGAVFAAIYKPSSS
jgi:TM2 domain-containing membrane protein YozV